MLRVAEIEIDNSSSSDDGIEEAEEGDADEEPTGRRVSFSAPSRTRAAGGGVRRRSPPPTHLPQLGDSDSSEEDAAEDDEDDDNLSLQRFPSASVQPTPRMIDDEGVSLDDEDEPELPSEDVLRTITGGEGNREWTEVYNTCVGCPCSKEHAKAPKVENMWLMPGKGGGRGQRAVVQVGEVEA